MPAPKKETKKSKSSKSKARTPAAAEDKKEAIKSVVFKGKSPVDDSCPVKDQVCQLICNIVKQNILIVSVAKELSHLYHTVKWGYDKTNTLL